MPNPSGSNATTEFRPILGMTDNVASADAASTKISLRHDEDRGGTFEDDPTPFRIECTLNNAGSISPEGGEVIGNAVFSRGSSTRPDILGRWRDNPGH